MNNELLENQKSVKEETVQMLLQHVIHCLCCMKPRN